MYKRKTRDEYEIESNNGYGWDYVCTAEDRADAKQLLKIYRENEPHYDHRIRKRRVKITE